MKKSWEDKRNIEACIFGSPQWTCFPATDTLWSESPSFLYPSEMCIAFHEFIKVKLDIYSSEYEAIKILLEVEISSTALRVCNKYVDVFWHKYCAFCTVHYPDQQIYNIYS